MKPRSVSLALLVSGLMWFAIFALAVLAGVRLAHAQPTGVIVDGEGTATISWTLPTTYEGGASLPPGEIDAIVIFYGEQSRFQADGQTLRTGCTLRPLSRNDATCYPGVIDMGGGTSRIVTLELTETTTVYFAVTAVTVNGEWSRFSNEAPKHFELVIEDERRPDPPTITTIDVEISCVTETPGVTCQFTVQ